LILLTLNIRKYISKFVRRFWSEVLNTQILILICGYGMVIGAPGAFLLINHVAGI